MLAHNFLFLKTKNPSLQVHHHVSFSTHICTAHTTVYPVLLLSLPLFVHMHIWTQVWRLHSCVNLNLFKILYVCVCVNIITTSLQHVLNGLDSDMYYIFIHICFLTWLVWVCFLHGFISGPRLTASYISPFLRTLGFCTQNNMGSKSDYHCYWGKSAQSCVWRSTSPQLGNLEQDT